jgi:hypothetical protein
VNVSLLVPFRDDGERGRLWDWCRARWQRQHPDWELVVHPGDDIEPFSKTTAVNAAAREANGDVFVVADADCWMDADITRALEYADSDNRLVVPWRHAYRLNAEDSAYLLDHPDAEVTDDMKRGITVTGPGPSTAGILFVISRVGFERVGGMDPRFRGYRFEDISFRRACDTLLGKGLYRYDDVFCLWHDRPAQQYHRRWRRVWGDRDTGELNEELQARYLKAERRPLLMRRICEEHAGPLPTN